jgi:hypothetical protein
VLLNSLEIDPMIRTVGTLFEVVFGGCLAFGDVCEQFGWLHDMSLIEGTHGYLLELHSFHESRELIYKNMSYWDINQYLAEEESIEFCFKTDAYFMDFLDSTKEGVIIEGQTINTAIWLVNTLYDYLELGGNCPLTQTPKPNSSKSPSPRTSTSNRWTASTPSAAATEAPSRRCASNPKCPSSTRSTRR